MAKDIKSAKGGEEFGEFAPDHEGRKIPKDEWMPVPISDSADYLNREVPTYVSEEEPSAEEAT